jgi:hypothetical protein
MALFLGLRPCTGEVDFYDIDIQTESEAGAESPSEILPPHLKHPAIKCDPIENDPAFFETLKLANHDAEAELLATGHKHGLGWCHLFWSVKKRILKEKYGIDWKSPEELNPHILFD